MSVVHHLDRAADSLRRAKHVVVFTGAGISAESGIPTFRNATGLWQRFPPDRFATWRGLLRTAETQPFELARFLLAILEPLAVARPNPGHAAIAELQRHIQVTVVTQNVDGLHQEAGSRRVLEVHGSLLQVVTDDGGFLHNLDRSELNEIIKRLKRALASARRPVMVLWAIRSLMGIRDGGSYRPSIVLFEEAMAEPDWPDALDAVDDCDCLLSVGTSGRVMPAAMLPGRAHMRGAAVINVGLDDLGVGTHLHGRAGEVLPQLLKAAFE